MLNMGGFIALSVIGLRNIKGSSGGSSPPSSGGQISLNTDTVKIFGLSAVVGFALSFIYLVVANM
jgi:hypothetical protein